MLHRLDVFDERVNSHVSHMLILAGFVEDRSPDGHLADAVLEQSLRIADRDLHRDIGVLAFISRSELGEIGRRPFERFRCGSFAFCVDAMADGAVLVEKVLSFDGADEASRNFFDDLGLSEHGDTAGESDEHDSYQISGYERLFHDLIICQLHLGWKR